MTHASPPSPPLPFRTAAVLGSGVMGSQIAAHLANAGLAVELLDLRSDEGPPNRLADESLKEALKASPAPFFTPHLATRVRTGNFDDHLDRLAGVDWIIEAVVERLDVKRKLLARVEEVAAERAVIGTNTSGLPIHRIAEGRGESFRRRFLGIHFFNPPRYLRLLELIPTADTDPEVLERVSRFGRLHLGKGVVVAKDTPNFIGNRIGIYAALSAIRQVTEHGFTIEEVDTLTGRLVGHPKSATFRTADLVGLDVLLHVANNLYEAVEGDESREAFRPPWILAKLVERGSLGAKTKEGFYKKVDGKILSIDPDSMEYRAGGSKLGDLDAVKKVTPLPERLRRLWDEPGRAGEFFRRTTCDLLGYAARRLPEIADEVRDVDRALRLGFAWEIGPFETWDALGAETVLAEMRSRSCKVPAWVDELVASGQGFYREMDGEPASWAPAGGVHVPRPRPDDEIDLARLAGEPDRVVWTNDEAALIDIGEGVLLYEFRSKMNALGEAVVTGLLEAIERVENGPWAGLVVGNDAEHFSVGANLAEVGMATVQGHWREIEAGVEGFQRMTSRVRYAGKPVVVCTQGRVLGGGCEMTMWCPRPVVAAESYIGLVEIAAGLLPAGGGTTAMAALAAERAATEAPEDIAPHLRAAFETIARARVALSGEEAVDLGFVSPAGTLVMNPDRRLWVARQQVTRLAAEGWRPPAVRAAIRVLGRPGRGMFDVGVDHMLQGGWIGEHDAHVARRIAWVLTGGDLPGPASLSEEHMLGLEREVFMSLLGTRATQQKIAALLTRNQPRAARLVAKGLVNLTSVFRRKRPAARKP